MKTYSKTINCKNKYQDIKNNYINEISSYTECQYKNTAIQIINDIINNAENNNSDEYLLEEHLDQALDLIRDLKNAINTSTDFWNKNEKIDHLYKDYNWGDRIKPWEHDSSHMIDIISLNEVISKYLSLEWFSSSIFEWIIINAYLRYVIELNRKEFFNSPPGSARSFAACFSTAHQYVISFLILKSIGIIINWILPISMIFAAFINEWFVTGIILTATTIISVFFFMISFPKGRKIRKIKIQLLSDLIQLKTYVSAKSWSPSFVMEKIKKLNQALFMQELIPLVAKMIKREPEIFNVTKI